MKIEKRNINELIPAEYNPRVDLQQGNDEYEKLKRSIETWGLVEPIVLNERTGKVVGGHQRLKVLQDLGYESVDVSVVDLDDNDEKALNIALNKIEGGWDTTKLKDLLEELDAGDFDVELTGFDMDEIEDLMTQFFDEDNEAEEDDFDVEEAIPEVPITKRGDIWQIGKHRLMCGDSTKQDDIARLMNDEKADMVFTDPPWNVNYGDVEKENARGYKPRKILNDFMGEEDFKEFMNGAFSSMNFASKEGCMTYVVMSSQEWGNMMLTLASNDYHWSSTIIWNKNTLVMSIKDYHTKYEPIWYGWKKGDSRLHPLTDRKQSDVWDIDRPTVSELHPTMKPIELVARAIQNSSNSNNIVLDLFGGSGSTLIACEQTNRINYSMELDEKYCDVIVKRWEEYTGEKAVLLNEEPNSNKP